MSERSVVGVATKPARGGLRHRGVNEPARSRGARDTADDGALGAPGVGERFLAEAARVLFESLDYEETLASLARLAVPTIADWCSVEILDDNGALRQLAVAHVDPAKVALARRLRAEHPLDPDGSVGAPAVVRSREPQVLWDIPEALLRDLTRGDDDLLRTVVELGLRSFMCVPLLARGRPLGAITLVTGESGRTYGQKDLDLAVDLAGSAAVAIEHAQLYRDVTQFKATLDATRDCIFMCGVDTLRFSYVNRGAIEQVGYTEKQLLRMTPLDIKPEFDETSYRALIAPLIEGTLPSRMFETVHRHKDGTLIPVEVVLQYVRLEGGVGRLVAVVRDIRERVDARDRLRRLAEVEQGRAAVLGAMIGAIGDGVVVCAPSGDVTLANPAALSLLNGPLFDYDDILDRLDVTSGPVPSLGAPQAQGPTELRLPLPEGRDRWLEMTAYPVTGLSANSAHSPDNGPVLATILVIRDVTTVLEARRAQEAFIGVLSHELRTPVTTIYGGAKVLGQSTRELSDEVRADVYSDIAAESERLYRLVEDLLVLARFERGSEATPADEPVLLQRLLPGVVASEQARWPSTRFESSIPNHLPTVRADRTYVEQLTRNLLSNAAKYGGTECPVRLVVEQDGDEVAVRVLDEGPGFAPDEASHLFDLFYRSPATAGLAGGAGIGLFVCRRLVEAMGGRIWAQPRTRPRGAEFGFALRILKEELE